MLKRLFDIISSFIGLLFYLLFFNNFCINKNNEQGSYFYRGIRVGKAKNYLDHINLEQW